MGFIVFKGLSSLHELQTIYTLEDALDLYEIATVHAYNEWVTIEDSKKNAR